MKMIRKSPRRKRIPKIQRNKKIRLRIVLSNTLRRFFMGRYRKKLWDSTISGFGLSVGFGLLCGILCCGVCALLSCFIFKSLMFGKISAVLSLCVSGYFSGSLCGRYRRRYGMAEGALCGCIIYGIILGISLIIGEFTSPVKLVMLAVSGAIGGISGVNKERPEKLM